MAIAIAMTHAGIKSQPNFLMSLLLSQSAVNLSSRDCVV